MSRQCSSLGLQRLISFVPMSKNFGLVHSRIIKYIMTPHFSDPKLFYKTQSSTGFHHSSRYFISRVSALCQLQTWKHSLPVPPEPPHPVGCMEPLQHLQVNLHHAWWLGLTSCMEIFNHKKYITHGCNHNRSDSCPQYELELKSVQRIEGMRKCGLLFGHGQVHGRRQ